MLAWITGSRDGSSGVSAGVLSELSIRDEPVQNCWRDGVMQAHLTLSELGLLLDRISTSGFGHRTAFPAILTVIHLKFKTGMLR